MRYNKHRVLLLLKPFWLFSLFLRGKLKLSISWCTLSSWNLESVKLYFIGYMGYQRKINARVILESREWNAVARHNGGDHVPPRCGRFSLTTLV